MGKLAATKPGPATPDDFASLPFYSLCHGLLWPLTGLAPERVAELDKARDLQVQGEILRLGLLTSQRIERPSATGMRPGLELSPPSSSR